MDSSLMDQMQSTGDVALDHGLLCCLNALETWCGMPESYTYNERTHQRIVAPGDRANMSRKQWRKYVRNMRDVMASMKSSFGLVDHHVHGAIECKPSWKNEAEGRTHLQFHDTEGMIYRTLSGIFIKKLPQDVAIS